MTAVDFEQTFAQVSDAFSGGLDDPYPIYAKLRRTDPVMAGDFQAQYGTASQAADPEGVRPVYTLFKYNDIMNVVRDPVRFTSGLMMEKYGKIVGKLFLPGLDGDEHKTTRALLQPSFSPGAVEEWKTDLIGPLARKSYVGPLKPKGGCNLLTEVAIPFPIHVIYRIIGFPDDPGAFERFGDLGLRILASAQTDPDKAAEAEMVAFQAAQDFYDLVLPIIVQRRAAGSEGEDLISTLLRAEVNGQTLDDDTITCFIRMLIPGAAETTTRTFAVLMTILLSKPELLEQLRADRSLIGKAVDESQRLEPANAFMARQTRDAITLRGVEIPAGAALLLATASANRDEEVFEQGEEFDMHRPAKHGMQFGFGLHLCLGIHTAKAEIEVLLNAILDEWPDLRLDPDYPAPVLRGMHFRGPDQLHVRWTA